MDPRTYFHPRFVDGIATAAVDGVGAAGTFREPLAIMPNMVINDAQPWSWLRRDLAMTRLACLDDATDPARDTGRRRRSRRRD